MWQLATCISSQSVLHDQGSISTRATEWLKGETRHGFPGCSGHWAVLERPKPQNIIIGLWGPSLYPLGFCDMISVYVTMLGSFCSCPFFPTYAKICPSCWALVWFQAEGPQSSLARQHNGAQLWSLRPRSQLMAVMLCCAGSDDKRPHTSPRSLQITVGEGSSSSNSRIL